MKCVSHPPGETWRYCSWAERLTLNKFFKKKSVWGEEVVVRKAVYRQSTGQWNHKRELHNLSSECWSELGFFTFGNTCCTVETLFKALWKCPVSAFKIWRKKGWLKILLLFDKFSFTLSIKVFTCTETLTVERLYNHAPCCKTFDILLRLSVL